MPVVTTVHHRGGGKASTNPNIHILKNRDQVSQKHTGELAGCHVRSDYLCHMLQQREMILAHNNTQLSEMP